MRLHSYSIFYNFRIRPSMSDQLDGSNLNQSDLSGPDLKICPPTEIVLSGQFVRGSSSPFLFMGVGTGRRTYILPHARASSRREHDPDGSVAMVHI
ncbi:hypothetical protein EVAR_70135_1 [Eumeta japonica]|uniref:Uncharacterized protein n=1 Tax=Eumeta variegata TaxID=151549 RepID=A0A4C1Z6Y7_EUMVA|nr:hypothetical protein EVAR_70135_1 [Eumeta japonica]